MEFFYSSEAGALNWSAKPSGAKFVRRSIGVSLSIVGLVVLHVVGACSCVCGEVGRQSGQDSLGDSQVG